MNGTGNSIGSTSYWICKHCGFEGTDSTPLNDEYSATKAKFNQSPSITKESEQQNVIGDTT